MARECNSISGEMNISIVPGKFQFSSNTLLNTERFVNRKGKDYTYLYGKHIGTGSLTPFIDKAFDGRVDE